MLSKCQGFHIDVIFTIYVFAFKKNVSRYCAELLMVFIADELHISKSLKFNS